MSELQQVEILLVEDNPQDAEMTLRSLKRSHIANNVHWVKDGAAALDFMFRVGAYAGRDADRMPRLVLLDIKMPKIDGIEVLRRLKGDERTRATPVVIMTSSNEERDVIDSYALGVNSYIVKPVQIDAFHRTIADIGLYWLLTNRAPERTG